MKTIDTRNLIDERTELQQTVLDAYNEEFETDFSDFDEINIVLLGDDLGEVDYTEEEIEKLDDFKDVWSTELEQIEEINDLEDEISSSEWDYGLQLIDGDDFPKYCEDLVSDIGDLPTDLPSYISNNIDWEGVAEDLKVDYSEVTFRGTTYLFR